MIAPIRPSSDSRVGAQVISEYEWLEKRLAG
jgi:hypothetical protein